MEPEIRYATTADGVSIAYYTLGQGPAVAVLPSLPLSNLQVEWQMPGFRDFLLKLGAGRTLIRYDPRGTGLSERRPASLSLDAHILDLVAVLDRAAAERCAVFAASYAGPIGVAFAARHPSRVERLVLWSTHAAYDEVAERVTERQSAERSAVLGLAAVDPELAIRTYLHHAISWQADGASFATLALASVEPGEFFELLGRYAAFDARPHLAGVTAPTLVVHRPDFRGSNVDVARRLASAIADARMILVPGTSVVPYIGDDGSLQRAVQAFLDEGLAHPENAGDRPAAPSGAERLGPQPAHPGGHVRAIQALMFTDIESHTPLIRRLGDDRGRAVLREHERLTRGALTDHSGREIKTMGDGFLASFDSVRDALDCAIALQRALKDAAVDSSSPLGPATMSGHPLRIRIGINAGEPVEEDDDLFGTAVVAVARIAAAAAGGQVLVADVARQLAAGKQFEWGAPIEVEVRGFSDPMKLYELRWRDDGPAAPTIEAPAVGPDPARVPRPPAPLVGRSAELAALSAAFDRAAVGGGGICLVSGADGMGKTRLAEEGAAIARRRGALILQARCGGDQDAPPLWPWIHILRELDRAAPGRLASAAGPAAKGTVERLLQGEPHPGESPTADPGQARFQLFSAVETALRVLAGERPLVVALDDLHNADTTSLALLEFVAANVGAMRVLLIATFKAPVVADTPLAQLAANLARLPSTCHLELQPLAPAEALELLEGAPGSVPAGPLAAEAVARAEGNPFFAIEVARMLGGGTVSAGLPGSIRDLVAGQIAPLSGECRRLLEHGAALGREFELATLERVPAVARGRVAPLDLIEEAELGGLIQPAPGAPGVYRFSQALVRDAVLEAVPSTRRARIHLALAQALDRGADTAGFELVSRVASHYVRAIPAGGAAAACAYSRRAADEAMALFAFEEAAQRYGEALSAHEALGGPLDERASLLLGFGSARQRSGDVRGSKESFRQAAEAARTLGATETLALAALGYAELAEAGVRDPLRTGLLEEALAALPDEDTALRARVLGLLAETLSRAPDPDRRLAFSAEAVAMARRLGDPETLAFALNTRHWAIWETGTFHERAAVAREMLDLARDAQDEGLALKARRWRVVNALEAGDPTVTEAEVSAYEQAARRLRDPLFLWRGATMRLSLLILAGRWEEAESAMAVAAARGEAIRSRGIARFFGFHRFMIARGRGGLPAIEEEVRASIERLPLAELRVVLTVIRLNAGRIEAARGQYEAVWASIVSRPTSRLGLAASCLLAEACAGLGDGSRASELLAELSPHAGRNALFGDTGPVLGPVTRYLALLAESVGQPGEALAYYTDAMERARRLGAPAIAAETAIDFVDCLLDSGGDPALALRLAEEASALARDFGLEGAARQAEERLAMLATGAQARPPGHRRRALPAGLTEREAEVLRLLARGLTNREAADELVLSVRTVERHIANVYAKIDAHSRAEATAFAIRHDLT